MMRRFLPPFVIVAAGVLAYRNALAGPFVFDDLPSIFANPHIARLWPLWEAMRRPPLSDAFPRPLVNLSFSVNYALGGFEVVGYHVVNVLTHLASALLLFGVVRRTLGMARVPDTYRRSAGGLAAAVALIWVAHPLLTQSVNYIIQRAELFAGLFSLATLYGLIRSDVSARQGRWWALAIGCCALGMMSKPVMVVTPVIALAYDRIVLSGSVREAFSRRRWLYLGLAATWLILAAQLRTAPAQATPSAGFGMPAATWLQYALTQPGVIVRYLRLALWPSPLCFDYQWPLARTAAEIMAPAIAVGILLAATWWACRRHPLAGFLGIWLFGFLAPTSSVIPIADLAAEHRMYLPLAAVAWGAALLGWSAVCRCVSHPAARRAIAAGLTVAVVGLFIRMTAARNEVYQSHLALWQDALATRPGNARAHNNIAAWLITQQRQAEALPHLREGVRLAPASPLAQENLASALSALGRWDEAVAAFDASLRTNPRSATLHDKLGYTLMKQGRLDRAAESYRTAIALNPGFVEAYRHLALVLLEQGKADEARGLLAGAIEAGHRDARLYDQLGAVLIRQGDAASAAACFRSAVELAPGWKGAAERLQEAQRQTGASLEDPSACP